MISIVDDDIWAREGIKSLLSSLGYEAIAFESAEHFVESGCIDATACLITDLQMPGMTGLDLQDQLRARGYKIPVIFVTAFPDEKKKSRALDAGAVGFLKKPIDEETFIKCLARAIGSGASTCVGRPTSHS